MSSPKGEKKKEKSYLSLPWWRTSGQSSALLSFPQNPIFSRELVLGLRFLDNRFFPNSFMVSFVAFSKRADLDHQLIFRVFVS